MDDRKQLIELFSRRELEILALLVENKTDQEIADQLQLSLSSVKWYAGKIFGKLGVENRHQAVKKAAELELLKNPEEPPPSLPSGIVTFLFTDIEGSTPLWEKMPEAMQVSVAIHHAILRQAIESNGGQVFQIIGDAFEGSFRLATDGLCAAVAAQRALQDAQWGVTGPLKVRMGIHTGAAERDPAGDAPYAVSHTLNRVARVMSAGYGGQILLSQEAMNLVERELPDGVTLRCLGEHHLKGMELPETLYQVVAADLPNEFPMLPTAIQNPNNLPQELTSFVGREEEIELLAKELKSGNTRLITLTGSGGTGKTRLSLKVAEKVLDTFPAGVWLVELASLGDPELVLPKIAQVLGVREVPGIPLINTLCSYLKNKRALLILDNCEHLLSACAVLAGKLLQGGSELQLLASSREILNVPGELSFRVPSLTVPEANTISVSESDQFAAVRLFVARAAQVSTGFTLNDSNIQAIATICRRLDGIPLAIELATSRVRVMPVTQIAARLDNVFRLLTGGARTVMPRQQTIKATIDWSYNLLNQKEKTALQRLSVFSGGWTLEAAEKVIPDPPEKVDCEQDGIESDEVLDVLASLVDKSLVILSSSESEEASGLIEPRYRVLETIRQYARDRLLEAGCGEAVRDRHLAYYLAFSEEAERHFRTKDQIHWLEQIDLELDNIRLALEWSLGGRLVEGMNLAASLKWFWHIRSRTVEGNTWFDRLFAREAEERGETSLAVGVQNNTYLLAWVRCVNALALDFPYHPVRITSHQLVDMLTLAIDLCRKIGASANRDLFWSLLYKGNQLPDGESLREEALEFARANRFRFEESDALFQQWLFCLYKSQDFEKGAQYLKPSLVIVKELQDMDGMAERMLGSVFLAAITGDLDRVGTLYDEAMSYHKQVNNLRSIHIWEIGFLRFSQDQQAIQQAEHAIQYFEEMHDLNNISYGYSYLAQAEWSNGNISRAEHLATQALSFENTTGQAPTENYIFLMLFASGLEIISGNFPKAHQHLHIAGGLIEKLLPVNIESRYVFLTVLSAYAVRTGDAARAARIFGAIDSTYQSYKNLLFPWQTQLHEEIVQTAQLALGEEAFRSAWEWDQTMTFYQVYDLFYKEYLESSEQ